MDRTTDDAMSDLSLHLDAAAPRDWLPSAEFLKALDVAANVMPGQRHLPWPMPGNIGGILQFEAFADWRVFFLAFTLHPGVPDIVRAKYGRALKLHLLGWLDFDLIKAGEMVALTTLELALKDAYGGIIRARKVEALVAKGKKVPDTLSIRLYLPELLECLVKTDHLTDNDLPINQRTGGTVLNRLKGLSEPSIGEIRNIAMHGDPFDGFSQSGLLELVRDLIQFAYRKRISEYDVLYGTHGGS